MPSFLSKHTLFFYLKQKGDACASKEEIELPEGWAWEDVWEADLNRAVDEDGKKMG